MATTYPGTINTFTDPSGTSPLATGPDHAQLHTDINDTLEAVQTVMGTTAGTAVLKNLTAGEFVVSDIGTATLTNKTLTSPALQGDISDWTVILDTLTYASASTINTSVDLTGIIKVYDKFKITQTTEKFFIVTAITSNLITVTAGTSYTVANAAITNPAYSKSANPTGFPHWFTRTATLGGVTVTTATMRFAVTGRKCFFEMDTGDKTSNATTFTSDLPIVSANNGQVNIGAGGTAKDNNVLLTTAAKWELTANSSTLNFYTNFANAAWTASSTKRISLNGWYEI